MKTKLLNYFGEKKKIIIASLSIGLLITLLLGATKGYSDSIQTGIANNVIRFHVIANSNSTYDQSLKLLVKEAVLSDLKDELSKFDSINDTRVFLSNSLERIKDVSLKTISDNGYDYSVKVALEKNNYFPTKEYGDIAFPNGNYEALKIIIENGNGNNWWCVMFPPLCFVDIATNVTAEKTKNDLKNILTDEEYDIVVTSKSENNLPYKVKFKIVEWWQKNTNTELRAKK